MGTFGIQAGQAAINAGSGILGSIWGLATAGINDRRQLKQQDRLNEQAYEINNRMAEENYKREMRKWEETNYAAQKEQLEKAGLNPGLLYGMSGGGGATAQSQGGQGVSAGQAPSGGGEIMGMTMAAMQQRMMSAQIKVMESQANKNDAEAQKTSGIDTEKAGAETKKIGEEIEAIKQNVKNAKAQEILTEAQTDFVELQTTLQTATLETNIAQAETNLRTTNNELERAIRRNWIEEQTKNTAINQIKADYIQTIAETELTKQLKQASIKGMQLTDAQIQRLAQETSLGWAQISRTGEQIGIARTDQALRIFESAVENNFTGIDKNMWQDKRMQGIMKLYENLQQILK